MLQRPRVAVRSVERSVLPYLIVAVRSAERSAQRAVGLPFIPESNLKSLAENSGKARQRFSPLAIQKRYDRRSDRRLWGVTCPSLLAQFVSVSLLSLFAFGCSRSTTTPALPQQEQVASGEQEHSPTAPSQSELPTTSTKELETKLALIRAEETAELRLEKRAPDDLPSLLAGLDGKLFDLLLDGGIDELALKELKNLPSLFHLRVRQSELGDKALASIIKNHPELQILNLPQAVFTQAGIRQLHGLTKLRQLRLGGNWLNDEMVAEIAKLPKLQHLHLIQPKLSAASLEALANSPKLTSLYIDDCELPDSAWKKLFDAKPKLHVHIDQHHHDRDPGSDGH